MCRTFGRRSSRCARAVSSMWSVLFVLVLSTVVALPPSPCPELYGYEKTEFGEVKGLIAILAPPRYSEIRVVTVLSSPAPLSSNDVGELNLKGGRTAAEEAIRQVLQGNSHVLQFYITFPAGKPIPTLLSITINGQDFCKSPTVPSDIQARITLHRFLKTGLNFPQTMDFGLVSGFGGSTPTRPPQQEMYIPQNNEPPQQPVISMEEPIFVDLVTPSTQNYRHTTPTTTTFRPTRTTTTTESSLFFEDDPPQDFEPDPYNCGVPESVANGLVVNGESAERGAWPWHVAIYKNNYIDATTSLTFICGGSLVTRRHVISAAHCVVEKRGTRLRKVSRSSLVLYLGKHNIRSWAEEGQQPAEVEDILVHPKYNENYNNDISILLLASSVKITRFVKPICLWDRSSDLYQIEGRIGSVPGWGKDETGSLADNLRVAKMPVISQETCIHSDTFYSTYTTNTTLCAGFKNGTTVCNGDSGGGLLLNLDNPLQGRRTWYLRGIVSVSMPDMIEQRCDIFNYVIFTDAAKYIEWLKRLLHRPA